MQACRTEPEDKHLEVLHWGMKPYAEAAAMQEDLVAARIDGGAPDRLIFVEHPDVVTIGRSGGDNDLLVSDAVLQSRGVDVCRTGRGGKATFHGPGQLVVYPVIHLADRDLHAYVNKMLQTAADVLRSYGLAPEYRKGAPGLWVNGAKIVSIGLAVKKWVAHHGIALNVANDLQGFDCIVPCGAQGEKLTSMVRELERDVSLIEVRERFESRFRSVFGYAQATGRHPEWLVRRFSGGGEYAAVEKLIADSGLATVCQGAHCPNIGECFGRKTATFMILGKNCTRNCRFCAVPKERPEPPDPDEPERVALAVKKLGLRYAVITSVTRDDLEDGGAGQFAATVRAIRRVNPQTRVEVLVPDFQGERSALDIVCDSLPDMFNHNIETVPRLYPEVRPMACFSRSLEVLTTAEGRGMPVKSGLMVGLGETREEIRDTLQALWATGCGYLTIGQYLSPSPAHAPVARYIPPSEFDALADMALSMGFQDVAAGPLVRSSYRAEQMFSELKSKIRS